MCGGSAATSGSVIERRVASANRSAASTRNGRSWKARTVGSTGSAQAEVVVGAGESLVGAAEGIFALPPDGGGKRGGERRLQYRRAAQPGECGAQPLAVGRVAALYEQGQA